MSNRKGKKGIYSSVSLPVSLIEKIKETIKGTGFTSVGSFVEYIVRSFVAEKNLVEGKKRVSDKEIMEGVRARLKALGYLD